MERSRITLSGSNNPLYVKPRSEEMQTGIIYPSITEAVKAIGVTRTAVAYVCHGRTKSVKGFTFRFVDAERA